MGRPVVATAWGSAGEEIRPGLTGWLVEPGDGRGLAQALDEALALGYDERQRLAEAALQDVRDRFSKESMCAGVLTVYAELLTPRPAGEVARPARA
jgi:glycosyltransferase involved in cell wall biosynthesis